MNLPELPSEQQITKWLHSFRSQIGRFVRTLWHALRSPTSLIRYSMYGRSIRGAKEQVAPLPFVLFTLVLASLLGTVADILFGVDVPFFNDLTYNTRFQIYGHWLTSLQKLLPVGFSANILLRGLKYAILLLVIVLWARVLAGSARRYWADVAAFSYLLEFVIIVDIVEYCVLHLSFRMIGEKASLFAGATLLISVLSAVIVYGVVLRVVDRVYFTNGLRRVLHMTGYVIVSPILLFILNLVFYMIPMGFYASAVSNPTVEGEDHLDAGNYEAAEKLFAKAIKKDTAGVLSAHAHIRLVSANAQRIIALLPGISGDSGMRERLLRHFTQTDPFRRVAIAWRSEGPINMSPAQLTELRETILRTFVTAGGIPVTTSELDCAISPTAADRHCDDLPKGALTRYANTPLQRQQLYYMIYRARTLRGEPTTAHARRYLQFLFELPIRIEIMFVRYRALNLARESETLAYLDDLDRSETLDRNYLIEGNREILNRGDKFPHLMVSGADIEKLTDKELGFHFRQAYLNYLRNEARLLAGTAISSESSLIRQQVASIEEQLKWVANNAMYRDIPTANNLEKGLHKLFGIEGKVVSTDKGL